MRRYAAFQNVRYSRIKKSINLLVSCVGREKEGARFSLADNLINDVLK